jgi:hypothetical protein
MRCVLFAFSAEKAVDILFYPTSALAQYRIGTVSLTSPRLGFPLLASDDLRSSVFSASLSCPFCMYKRYSQLRVLHDQGY